MAKLIRIKNILSLLIGKFSAEFFVSLDLFIFKLYMAKFLCPNAASHQHQTKRRKKLFTFSFFSIIGVHAGMFLFVAMGKMILKFQSSISS